MVDSTQMEKFEFDKSNQTYLGNNSKNNDNENNFDESNQTYLGNKSYNISNNNNFEKSNQTYLGNNNKNNNYENGFIFFSSPFRSSSGWSALWHPKMGSSRGWTLHVS